MNFDDVILSNEQVLGEGGTPLRRSRIALAFAGWNARVGVSAMLSVRSI